MHRARDEFDQAEAAFRRAAEIDPTLVVALYDLASLLAMQGRFDEAVVELRHILSVQPQHADALAALAEIERRASH